MEWATCECCIDSVVTTSTIFCSYSLTFVQPFPDTARTEHPIPATCETYYFEATIISCEDHHPSFLIGLYPADQPVEPRLLGMANNSFFYHAQDGATVDSRFHRVDHRVLFSSYKIVFFVVSVVLNLEGRTVLLVILWDVGSIDAVAKSSSRTTAAILALLAVVNMETFILVFAFTNPHVSLLVSISDKNLFDMLRVTN